MQNNTTTSASPLSLQVPSRPPRTPSFLLHQLLLPSTLTSKLSRELSGLRP